MSAKVAQGVMGSVEPRLSTPPLRPITRKTSAGFALCDWARDILGVTLLPHQEHLFKHALELDPAGGYRFRTVLVMAGRQGGGKSTAAMVLSLWRLFHDAQMAVLSSAQRDSAREGFLRTVAMIEGSPLANQLRSVRRANGSESLELRSGARLKVVAANDKSARGLSVDLAMLDELRTHDDYTAWAAVTPTTLARPRGQIWAFSNAGTAESVVLNGLRAAALTGTDPTLGLFEWSAPPGADLDDESAWAAALPGLGRTVTAQAVRSAIATTPAAVARTEYLCERVESLTSLFDLGAWDDCADASGSLDSARDRVVAAVDVAPDLAHVSLAVAAVGPSGVTRVELAGAWPSVAEARDALPDLLDRIRPRSLGIAPGPSGAALGVDLKPYRPTTLTVAETAQACAGLVEQVASRRLLHSGDGLLTAQVAGAQRLPVGDSYRFTRASGHVDAVYASAIAVHVARMAPAPRPLRLVTARTDRDQDGNLGNTHAA